MVRLTEKDKLVFYALTRWPELNDTELSDKTGIKRSTITAIKNKLEKNDFYTTIKVPDLEKLGCELLTVRYGSFNPMSTYELRQKYSSTQKFPEVIFKRTTDRQRIALNAAKNFTEVKKYIDYSNKVYGEEGFLTDEGIIHVLFPLRVSKVLRFFDYAPLLRRLFDLHAEKEEPYDSTEANKEETELNENEKMVLYATMKYPKFNDNEIAKKVSMTRQFVSAARKKFEKEGLVRTARMPNLEALGFQLLVMMHVMINPKASVSAMKSGIQKILSQGAHIFYALGNLEFVLISAYRDYPEYNRTLDEIVGFYKTHDLLFKEPVARIFVTNDIKSHVDGRFAPIVKKILGINKEV
ncbi:MAG: hypothetical protein PHG85_01580 [Candidatus Altiarchaeota archaeon]|nr:hypothetical protein [Candidatus Altiarchaeota archaeon]